MTPIVMTFGGYLRRLAARVDDGALDGLRPAMRWLLDHRPPEPAPLSICHGDFHPHNLLYARGAVTGVLDWPNTLVADPLYDVASTLMIVRHTPSELWGLSGPLRWIAAAARQCLVRMYLARFRRRRQLDWAHLSYYEAANAMRWLVQAALHRLQRDAPVHTLDDSSFAERLAERFAEVTGIAPVLPAPRR